MFRKPAGSVTYDTVTIPNPQPTWHEMIELFEKVNRMSPAQLWATQTNVRTVVDFLARNIGQLGWPVYQRVSDTDRVRLNDSPVSALLENPNPAMTGYDLKVSLVSDIALYDEAWWVVAQNSAGWQIRPLAVSGIQVASGSEVDGSLVIRYVAPGATSPVEIPLKNLLHFRSWTPNYSDRGSPVVVSLKDMLAEQLAAQKFRAAIWKNGGQIGQYIARPKDAPKWTDDGAKRFKEDLTAYRANGGKEGSMPVLEDGMIISTPRFNAREEQWLEATQLAVETVARAWHINPAMLGATGGVSYANVREFRKMLYGETLGPWLKMIQDRINAKLVPLIDPRPGVYMEFNVKAKLAASFDEQAAVLSSSVGRPWMTADEARGLENMPALGGEAAQLVTPLNVLVGGQASPRDSAPKGSQVLAKTGRTKLKAGGDSESVAATAAVVKKFFKRQRSVVLSRLSAKSDNPLWWDGDRWDKELGDDLFKAAVAVSSKVGADALAQLGYDPDEYDVDRTLAFLKAVAKSRAGMINATTLAQLQKALADPGEDENGDPLTSPESVFDDAEDARGDSISTTLSTTFSGFAVTEAAQQQSAESTKTWVVNAANPRPEHAAMDGETVPAGESFSNGANWPGDPVLGAEGVANCTCTVEITVP